MECKVLDTYNVAVGSVVAVLTGIFGPHWYIFAAYLFLQICDFFTGWYKSRVLHTESSRKGLNGIAKKVGYWIIIAVAFIISDVFINLGSDLLHINLAFLTLIGWFTIACLMINEVRSIFENLVEGGCKVPEILIKGLAVTEKLIEDQAGEQVKKE